ncbi:rhodanese-like domain-containing protein [Desemzia sp. RIT804]|uniref:rhodanese-like domain-containing protein n=1 Tax=Desemzia sp. RIT 804 TaxID=2810209 RepID=UPI00194FCC13|nr:rhodanese-like domain-containing protein [Desemzia sp. RIT 804]MBM6614220.1 rhodanese-like domain-containing protein [Desemzia sp. RIT 804]
MDTSTIINYILWGFIIAWGVYELVQYFRRKNASVELPQEDFSKRLRKVQLVDIREKDEFDAGHILGARNVPYSMLKQRITDFRKDQPIYLYDDNQTISKRAALKLRKAGYTDLYTLKGGYKKWTGKIKRKAR